MAEVDVDLSSLPGVPFSSDSPFIQRELMNHRGAEEKFLNEVAKEMRSFNKGLKISITSAVLLAEKMRGSGSLRKQVEPSLGASPGLVQLDPVFQVFADVLYEVSAAQERLSESLETSFIAPVENFLKVEAPKVTELRKRLNSASEAHDAALGKYLRPPAHSVNAAAAAAAAEDTRLPQSQRKGLLGLLGGRGGGGSGAQAALPSPGIIEGSNAGSVNHGGSGAKRNADVASTLRDFELARFNLTYKLNEIEARKTFEISECVVASLNCFKTSFHQSLDTFSTLEPLMNDLQAKQQAMRDRFARAKQPWEVRRQQLNEVLWSAVASATSLAGGVSALNTPSLTAAASASSPPLLSMGSEGESGFDLEATLARLSPLFDERPAPSRPGVVKEGYLFMRSNVRLRVLWVRRWFILDGTTLSFVKSPETALEPATPVSDMLLSTVRDVCSSSVGAAGGSSNSESAVPFGFELFSANRSSQMLQASSSDDFLAWTTALRGCIENKLVRNGSAGVESLKTDAGRTAAPAESSIPHSPARQRRLSQTAAMSSSSSPSSISVLGQNSPHHTRAASSESVVIPLHATVGSLGSPRKNPAKLQSVINFTGNGTCADCTETHPEWVSMNLGVLLCIECSGIHRSLGSHVSKVRSLTLDRLGDPTLSLLLRLGNTVANAVFEHTVQEGWTKPGSCSSSPPLLNADGIDIGEASATPPPANITTRAAREQWIRSKYLYKGFVSYDEAMPQDAATASATRALFLAASGDDVRGCLNALAHGADINALSQPKMDERREGSEHCTALHQAAAKGFGDVVEFLLLNGADSRLRSAPPSTGTAGEIGYTALELAETNGHMHVARSLKT
jgi:hypothetical protein